MSDLISRQAAIDALSRGEGCGNVCRRAIKTLPTVQPKRGTWIPVTNGRGGHECDQCHNYAPSYQNGKEYLSDFCPHCGADMRTKETDCDYERAVEQLEHDMLYEPAFDPDDGSV